MMAAPVSPVSYGAIRRRSDLGPYRLTETVHPPGAVLPHHAHEFPAITLVLSGGFAESFAGADHDCPAFSLLFKPAASRHANRYGRDGARSLIIEITSHESASPLFAGFDRCAPQTGLGALLPLALAIYRAAFMQDETSALGVEELLLELASKGSRTLAPRAGSAPPPWLAPIMEAIVARPDDHWRLWNLAENAGVHPAHFARSFRRYAGITLTGFVHLCRVDHAVRFLGHGVSVAATTHRLGYHDQSHFTRLFRRLTGGTPALYRRCAARVKTVPEMRDENF